MRRLLQIIFLLMIPAWLMTAAGSSSSSAGDGRKRPDLSFYERFPFIRFAETVEEADMIRLSDDEFLDEAGRVEFRVDRYDVLTNDSLLRLLDEVVIPQIRRDSLHLLRMILRGAASPEGPFDNNLRLGQKRVEMLGNFMRERLSVSDRLTPFNTEVVIEDYRLLCAMMRRAGDPDFAHVQVLCNSYLPQGDFVLLKERLMEDQGGRLWRRLLKSYFPELRATRLVMVFEKYPSSAETAHEPVPAEHVVILDTVAEPAAEVPEPLVKKPRRELLAVKSNLLFDVAYVPGYNRWCPIPNVAVEFFPLHGHFTFGASIDFPWWQDYWAHKYFQVRNYQVEARYYLRSGDIERRTPGQGAAFRGLYFQAYAHAGLFDLCFDADRGWEGEMLGGGLGIGYVLPISKKGHWRLEFGLQVGYIHGGYDPYQFENPVNPNYRDHLYYYKWTGKPADFRERQYRFNWIGPTRVGVTLSYDLLYRRNHKKGVSFRPWEWDLPQKTLPWE